MSKRLVLAVVFSFCCLQGFADIIPAIHPKPHEGYEVKDDKIYFRRKNAGLILESATTESITKYYSDRGINMGNPFSGLGGDTTIFILTLLNRTNDNVTFTPGYVVLRIKTEAYFPLDFPVLLEFTEGLGKDMTKVLENSIYVHPELVPPGKIVTKFLIYPELPKKFEDFRLEFDYMFFEIKEMKLQFYFTRPKIKEEKD